MTHIVEVEILNAEHSIWLKLCSDVEIMVTQIMITLKTRFSWYKQLGVGSHGCGVFNTDEKMKLTNDTIDEES